MHKGIKNWHLSVLVGIISIISIAMIEQYALAQWNDPIGLPGETNGFRLVVNPMTEDLLLNSYDLIDSNLRIDANGPNVIQVSNGANICFDGTSDCINSWSGISNSPWQKNGLDIFYNTGKVGIGVSAPERLLEINAKGSEYGLYPTDAARLRISGTKLGRQAPGLEFFNIDKDNGTKAAKIVSRDEYIFSFEYENKGEDEGLSQEKLLVIHNDGAIGIGERLPGLDTALNQGALLFFDGALSNSDWLFLSRYNAGSDKTELRVGIGDNANQTSTNYLDKFVVGATDTNTPGYGTGPDYYFGDQWYPRFTVTSAGDVGIGTTEPNRKLDIEDNNSLWLGIDSGAKINTAQIEFRRGNNVITDYSWIGPSKQGTFDIWTTENIPMVFGISGGERMKLSLEGNLSTTGTIKPGNYSPAVICTSSDYGSLVWNDTCSTDGCLQVCTQVGWLDIATN